MDADRSDSRRVRYEERDDLDESPPVRKHRDRGGDDHYYNEEEEGEDLGDDKMSKHSSRDKDRKKSSRGDDRDRDREPRREREKDRERDKERGKERSSRDSKAKEKERRDRDKEKEHRDKDRDRDREKDREREKLKEREKHKDRESERDIDRDRDRDRERERGRGKSKEREKERPSKKGHEDDDRSRDDKVQMDYEEDNGKDTIPKKGKVSFPDEDDRSLENGLVGGQMSTVQIEDRILKMKEERLKKRSEDDSEVLAWVGKSRKLVEKKNAEKEKAMQLSKIFEEQDNIVQAESDNEEASPHKTHDLAGVKVRHGLDKVMEGGAVVLTLKDQSILADGDINQEVDVLENVEIGEQKRRDEAYRAAKKKTGVYDDKFNNDPAGEKKILPQYDDPNEDDGLALDEKGRFTGEAEKKLEELRRRLQGASGNNRFEDLTSSGKISSDYYTQEEMLQFKKPKKKKSLRKKEKLDIDALEAEAVSSGLGVGDLGSRNDGRRQAIKEEQERSEAEMRSNAYQLAYTRAAEASKSLRLEQTLPAIMETDGNPVFADDDEDLYKSLERTRKLALKKQEEEASGPQAIARLAAAAAASNQVADDQHTATGETQENKVVFTEVEEFVWGLQLDEETHKPESDDVFKDEDEAPSPADQGEKNEAGGWMEVEESDEVEKPVEDKEDIVPDETLHEVAVGKGLSGALKLLKERGTLKESVEWGGRNMDKKKSKLVGVVDNDAATERFKDIRIERTDEFGRIMTPKEAFRWISHKFHGKGPGKMKQEKRMKQYQEELKLKQMKNSDTPSLSVERMREAQAQLKTPYLILSGHVKTGQNGDGSGFANVEKDLPGSLTPMLGDNKVEHFLGIKRKAEPGNSNPPKKPKT